MGGLRLWILIYFLIYLWCMLEFCFLIYLWCCEVCVWIRLFVRSVFARFFVFESDNILFVFVIFDILYYLLLLLCEIFVMDWDCFVCYFVCILICLFMDYRRFSFSSLSSRAFVFLINMICEVVLGICFWIYIIWILCIFCFVFLCMCCDMFWCCFLGICFFIWRRRRRFRSFRAVESCLVLMFLCVCDVLFVCVVWCVWLLLMMVWFCLVIWVCWCVCLMLSVCWVVYWWMLKFCVLFVCVMVDEVVILLWGNLWMWCMLSIVWMWCVWVCDGEVLLLVLWRVVRRDARDAKIGDYMCDVCVMNLWWWLWWCWWCDDW